MVKNVPANARNMDMIPVLGRCPGKGNGKSMFAWEIPRTEEPDLYSPRGCKRVWRDFATKEKQL